MTEKRKSPVLRFRGYSDDWEQRKLGDVVQITMGQSPDGSTYSDEPSDYILVQGNADLQNGRVCPRIWTTQITKKADAGDLIMSVRAPAGAMGKTAYNAVIGRGVAAIKGNEFIYQLLVKMDADGFWKTLSCGSTFESLNSDNIRNAEVKIPTTPEQIKIGGYFQHLDHLITLHQRKLEKLKLVKKSMLEKMFPKNGSNVPEVRFKGFTDDWEQRKLEELLTQRVEHQKISEKEPLLAFSYAEGVIDPEDKKSNKRDFIMTDKYNKIFSRTEVEDIIYNPANVIHGAIHRNALKTGVVSPIYKIFKCNEDISPKYMGEMLHTDKFISEITKYIEGTVVKLRTLSPEKFLDMEIELPKSMEEQEAIGSFFTNIDSLITLHQCKVEKLQIMKKSMLEKMFV